jgi:hypothetical protein
MPNTRLRHKNPPIVPPESGRESKIAKFSPIKRLVSFEDDYVPRFDISMNDVFEVSAFLQVG